MAHLDHEHQGEGERGQDEEDGEEGDEVGAEARALSALHILRGQSLPTLLANQRRVLGSLTNQRRVFTFRDPGTRSS